MIGEPVVIITPGVATGRYGDEQPDWSTATSRTVAGAAFAPAGAAELNSGRTAVIEEPTLYLPAGTVVTAACRVQVRGSTYEAVGDPADWRNPFTGARPGVVLRLRRIEG